MIKKQRSDSVMVRSETFITHVVDVDLVGVLAGLGIGLEDNVVLAIQTPSGRAKRITLGHNFLIEPIAHNDDWDNRL